MWYCTPEGDGGRTGARTGARGEPRRVPRREEGREDGERRDWGTEEGAWWWEEPACWIARA